MTDTDRKLAEEILLSKFPLLPAKSNKEGMDRIVLAMEEYHQQKLKSPTDEEIKEAFASNKFITNVCLSYRHDFALMDESQRSALAFECKEWMRAIINNWPYREKLTGKSEEKQIGVTAPIVTDEEINIIEFISEWPYEDDFVSQNIQMSMSYGYASDNSLELAREWRKQYKGLLEILSRLQPVGKTDKLLDEQGAPFDEGIK